MREVARLVYGAMMQTNVRKRIEALNVKLEPCFRSASFESTCLKWNGKPISNGMKTKPSQEPGRGACLYYVVSYCAATGEIRPTP